MAQYNPDCFFQWRTKDSRKQPFNTKKEAEDLRKKRKQRLIKNQQKIKSLRYKKPLKNRDKRTKEEIQRAIKTSGLMF